MTPFVTVRAAVTIIGILVFVYGVRADSTEIRWGGVGVLAAAFLLRFFDPARRR